MGSEGYLINQFICERTNKRTDDWGGSSENRMRFPVEIVRAIRERVGPDFIIIFRLSMLDLVEQGSSLEEVITLGKALEQVGVTLINTGIGWHEARIPTIATSVPRGAFSWVTAELKKHLKVPLITTNRINTPEVAERILAGGEADMVSMARPFWRTRNLSSRLLKTERTRSTPASPATRPASTMSSSRSGPPAWSTRAPASRPSSPSAGCLSPRNWRWWAPAPPGWRLPATPPSAAIR